MVKSIWWLVCMRQQDIRHEVWCAGCNASCCSRSYCNVPSEYGSKHVGQTSSSSRASLRPEPSFGTLGESPDACTEQTKQHHFELRFSLWKTRASCNTEDAACTLCRMRVQQQCASPPWPLQGGQSALRFGCACAA